MASTSIYSVADRRHFLGAAALVNSLRLTGHEQPIVILDCGLEDSQRALLGREAAIIRSENSSAPHLLKWVAPLQRPADLMLLIDAGIIVTRSLEPLFEQAATGKVVAFADALASRHDPRWGPLLDLPPPRRQPYVSSGVLVFPRELGLGILEGLSSLAGLIDEKQSMVGQGVADDPFYFLDQDLLNALLASRIPLEDLSVLEHRLTPNPPFGGVQIMDPVELRCAYDDGTEPFALHHIQRKPWLAALPSNPYSELQRRLLTATDVPLRVPPAEVPLRLRGGALALLDRRMISIWVALTQRRRSLGIRRRRRGGARGS